MFYLYQSKVCVTPVGKTIPEYKAVKKFCEKNYKTNNLFVDICKYTFFVYHKVDSLGNKNPFYAYPLKERREVVVEKYGLFDNIKHPTEKRKVRYEDVYIITDSKDFKVVNELVEFYKKICYTESERTREILRQKIDHWRDKYNNLSNTPDEDGEYFKALTLAEKQFAEYEIKVMLESSTEEEGGEGCPLYLFEIPESQKPMHHRLQYGDLKQK